MDATSTIDPRTIPTITLTSAELDEAEKRIEAGELPPNWFQLYYAAIEANVFGADVKHDSNGRPIEQGLGSPSNMTHQSVEAYRKYGKEEPEYERNLVKMEKQLVDSNARRAVAARNAKPNKHGRVG